MALNSYGWSLVLTVTAGCLVATLKQLFMSDVGFTTTVIGGCCQCGPIIRNACMHSDVSV